MPFVPAAGIVSMQAIWSLDNQNVENTFNYHLSGSISFSTLQAMATTYFTFVAATLSAWPTNASVLKAYLRDLTTATSAAGEFIPSSPLVGTATGTVLPNSCTIAIKRETNLAGRANRGRVFWIGLREADRADDNHVLPARALNFVGDLNTLMNAQLADNSATEVILHRKTGLFTPIVGYTMADFTIDNQRRRLPDHNRHH